MKAIARLKEKTQTEFCSTVDQTLLQVTFANGQCIKVRDPKQYWVKEEVQTLTGNSVQLTPLNFVNGVSRVKLYRVRGK